MNTNDDSSCCPLIQLQEHCCCNNNTTASDSRRPDIFTMALNEYNTYCYTSNNSHTVQLKPMGRYQVGGKSQTKPPILIPATTTTTTTMNESLLYKPCSVLKNDHRGVREVAFYQSIQILLKKTSTRITSNERELQEYSKFVNGNRTIKNSCETGSHTTRQQQQQQTEVANEVLQKEIYALQKLIPFLPTYYGLCKVTNDSPPTHIVVVVDHRQISDTTTNYYIVLSNVLTTFKNPYIIDIKMGTQTYEPDATNEKRMKEYTKYKQQEVFGLRIVAMHLDSATNATTSSKSYGRSCKTYNQLVQAFCLYFNASSTENQGRKEIRNQQKTIQQFIHQIDALLLWFMKQKSLRFYSSSVLLVYEGTTTSNNEMNDVSQIGKPILKMIDFGHVRRDRNGDPGCIHGLQTLRKIFVTVQQQHLCEGK